MRNIVLNDFYFLIGQLVVGFAILLYFYNRKEFPRNSRFYSGCLLIIYAASSVVLIEFAMRDLDLFSSTLITAELRKQDISNALLTVYSILKLVVPFSFAAVGAGLIANSLVSRP